MRRLGSTLLKRKRNICITLCHTLKRSDRNESSHHIYAVKSGMQPLSEGDRRTLLSGARRLYTIGRALPRSEVCMCGTARSSCHTTSIGDHHSFCCFTTTAPGAAPEKTDAAAFQDMLAKAKPGLVFQDALSKKLPPDIHHKMLLASRTLALGQMMIVKDDARASTAEARQ